ncbi:MAG TPA: SDR family oxidoreductase [Burkholderiaceae bacterium]|nr:SDR family oxidoreductase [Burkholderiaceae bacterium]
MTQANQKVELQKVAIVTGSSRGIGAAVAQRLARDGFAVVVNYAGNAAAAQEVVQHVVQAGGNAIAVKADVSDAAAVRALFDAAQEAFGRIDVLVNNAGILANATIADNDDASFDRHIAINLKGSFNGMREAAKRLHDGGRIINLSTSLVGTLLPTYGVYTATKAAVEVLTSVLSKEMRGRNITVNAVAPGPTATELFLDGKTQEYVDHFAKIVPLERLGQPEDIAAAVSFLAGADGGWINGQTLRANGGLV